MSDYDEDIYALHSPRAEDLPSFEQIAALFTQDSADAKEQKQNQAFSPSDLEDIATSAVKNAGSITTENAGASLAETEDVEREGAENCENNGGHCGDGPGPNPDCLACSACEGMVYRHHPGSVFAKESDNDAYFDIGASFERAVEEMWET